MKAASVFVAGLSAAIGVAASPAVAQTCSGPAGSAQLSVSISGVRPARGEVAVTVYPDDRRRFLAPRGKLVRRRIGAEPTTRACFKLEPGYYAVAVYHDANADRDFNRNRVGLPTEGFGFSNDAPTNVGLPAFDAVRFRVKPGENAAAIRMRYRG